MNSPMWGEKTLQVSEESAARLDLIRQQMHDEDARIRCLLNDSCEQECRKFVRDNRTHRMNVMLAEEPQIRFQDVDGKKRVTISYTLELIFPKGWVAPLP